MLACLTRGHPIEFFRSMNFYRPQTKFAKVMLLQVSVCPQGVVCLWFWGRHPPHRRPQADTPQADTPPADTPSLGRPPRQTPPPWVDPPGQTPLPWADTPSLGRHNLPGQTQPPWADTPSADTTLADTPPPSACWDTHSPLPSACWDTVNKRAVRIPLECILVCD